MSDRKEYMKKWREENKEHIKQYKKEEHKAKEYCTFRPKSLSNSSTARFRKQIDTNTYSIPKNKITEEEK